MYFILIMQWTKALKQLVGSATKSLDMLSHESWSIVRLLSSAYSYSVLSETITSSSWGVDALESDVGLARQELDFRFGFFGVLDVRTSYWPVHSILAGA